MKNSLLLLLSMLCASAALAEPPVTPSTTTQKATTALVEKQLLMPLEKAQSRRRRFSRAAPVAVQRRVRVLDSVAKTDVRGKGFVRFAVDQRYGRNENATWEQDALLGCAYLEESKVFVQRGDDFLPASSMLGGDEKARTDVCRTAPTQAAEVASTAR
jgi:hypothetical protein